MLTKLPALLFVAFFMGIQQTPPEAYPGQRQHAVPPKGFFCSAEAKDVAHKCSCKRMSEHTTDDPVCEDTEVQEDPTCTVFCHPLACKCKITCTMPEHHHVH